MARSFGKRYTEYLIYLFFWGVLLLSPLFGAFLKDIAFWPTKEEMLSFWAFLLPALILFFLNNTILMPFLLYKKKGRLFVLYLLCIMVVFTIIYMSFPLDKPPGIDNVKVLQKREVWGFFVNPRNVQILIATFVLVFNVCVRLLFFTIRRDEHVRELEKEQLRSNLEYLRYQINPHFFMNSLNNIHALIDIDKEKAQSALIELSGLMRYVLYDKSSMFLPLEKEIQFLGNYIDLMRLRYTDKLEIKTSFASEPQGVYVPSLLFMQFVENAFKHGVTYKKQSQIYVSFDVDEDSGNVVFICRNTLPEVDGSAVLPASGGIGFENARKRLDLLYGEKASLDISNDGNWYSVELKIPIRYDQVYNC